MNLLDVAIVLAVLSTAAWGAVQGVAVQLGVVAGLWSGLLVGAWVAPLVAGLAGSSSTKLMITVGTLVLLGSLFTGLGRALGGSLGKAMEAVHLGPLDAVLGAVVTMVATLALLWMGLTSVASARMGGLTDAIQGSAVLTALDDRLPPAPSITARLGRLIDPLGFPSVFAGLEPGPAPAVDPPTAASVAAAQSAGAAATVKIESKGCGGLVDGSGVVLAPEIVVTNAHVIAGIRQPIVIDDGRRRPATTLVFDAKADLAVLRVPGLERVPATLSKENPSRGAAGAALGFPGGGDFDVSPAAVRAVFSAVGRDIYGESLVTRTVVELQAVVRPGNSGGPLVMADGTVGGLVFARSVSTEGVGYALGVNEVRAHLEQAVSRTAAVGTGDCAAG